ncbi:hypothetical protein OAO87_00885 [bacterium]|nr:hypothetical protein [bacterium]
MATHGSHFVWACRIKDETVRAHLKAKIAPVVSTLIDEEAGEHWEIMTKMCPKGVGVRSK